MWNAVDWFLEAASGEALLKFRPNSGAVVFLRSLWTSAVVYLLALAIWDFTRDKAAFAFSGPQFAKIVHDTVPWFGAVFAATYAGLYSRFASQWAYLADLYNQILSTEAQAPAAPGSEAERIYAAWKAGFIEDAEDVHLATKSSYAGVIISFLSDQLVRTKYAEGTVGGEARLCRLEKRVRVAFDEADRRWHKRLKASRITMRPNSP